MPICWAPAILREAFRVNLISDGEAWMLMIQDRNLTSQTYNRATALDIEAHIQGAYLSCFQALRTRLERPLAEES